MGDVLSQNEIDNLLKALSSGELDADEIKDGGERQVKDYDFARPSKFSKEHLRTLENIFEHYGRLLSTNLPAYFRKNVQVEVINSEAVAYSEFTNALSNPVLLGIVDFAPLEGNIILELSQKLGYAMLDRMLGGDGKPLERARDFTEIELIILERIFNVCTNLLSEPWENVVRVEPRLVRIKVGNIEGMMNVCLPYTCLETVIDKLNTKYWYSQLQTRDESAYQDLIEVAISKAKIPIKAVLGKSTISINDFLGLQCGDIIKLNTRVEDELDIYVGSINKFKALPGASSDSYAVRVSSIIREE